MSTTVLMGLWVRRPKVMTNQVTPDRASHGLDIEAVALG